MYQQGHAYSPTPVTGLELATEGAGRIGKSLNAGARGRVLIGIDAEPPTDNLRERVRQHHDRFHLHRVSNNDRPPYAQERTNSRLGNCLTRTEKRGLLEGLVDRIVVRDGTIEIRHYDLVHSLTSENAAQGHHTVAPAAEAEPEAQSHEAPDASSRARQRPTKRLPDTPPRTAAPAISLEDAPLTLLTRKQLRALVPVSDMTIWRWTREGTFPEPIRQHGRTYWRASEIQAWIEARSGERRAR